MRLFHRNKTASTELSDIDSEVKERAASWCHRFDATVDHLLQHGDVMKPRDLIRYAEEITDLAQAAVERKKTEFHL